MLHDPDQLFSISLKTKYNIFKITSASETVKPILFTLKTEKTQQVKELEFHWIWSVYWMQMNL